MVAFCSLSKTLEVMNSTNLLVSALQKFSTLKLLTPLPIFLAASTPFPMNQHTDVKELSVWKQRIHTWALPIVCFVG